MLVTKFKSPWFPLRNAISVVFSLDEGRAPQAPCALFWKTQPAVVGYFAYIRMGFPCSPLNPEGDGLAMQDHLFRKAIHPIFWLDNTTQISNRPVYRNHVNSGRKPHSISLIFQAKHGH